MGIRPSRISLATLTALASLALIPACSGTSSPPASTTSTSPTAPTHHGAFGECLQQHGVPAPAGPLPQAGAPPGVDEQTWDKAMQTCGSMAPAPPGPG